MTPAVRIRPRAVWVEPPAFTSAELSITDWPILSAVLRQRGVESREQADAFLEPRSMPLGDPALLPDLERAAARIRCALAAGQRIAVFGDYDVDGLSSTAMLTRVLRRLGGDPLALVPHRMNDGYGLNMAHVERLAADGVRLLVTVDCGGSNAAEVAALIERGVDVAVIDHHQYAGPLPPEAAYVSPRRPDSRYPCAELAAVGVAYQVVRALLGDADAEMYLPYVALGTVTDIVDLRGENRALVARGIAKLRRWKLPGLMALCAAAGIDQAALSSFQIGFIIGPRLNAAGRMASPSIALDLLLADDAATATPLALQLSDLNERRKAETKRVVAEAESIVDALGDIEGHPALVVAHDDWSVGIAGLVANRLVESYHRPAIVLQRGEETSHGSARSIEPIDILAAIAGSAELLERFGGHRGAAGLTLPTAHLEAFQRALNATVLDMCGGQLPARRIKVDAVASADDLRLQTVDIFDLLEPTGHGNREPVLLVRDLGVRYPKASRDGRHLLFQVQDERHRWHSAVYFNAGQRLRELTPASRVDVLATLRRDTWDGRERLKLHLVDFRPAV